MKPYSVAIGAVLLCLAGVLRAHPQTAGPSDRDSTLRELAWLVGTWKSSAQTPEGRPAENEFTLEWGANGKALRYSITRTVGGVTTPLISGLCTWHPVKKRVVLWEASSDGSVTESLLTVAPTVITYDEIINAADGSTLPVRASAVREGNDAFHFRARVEQKGEWKVVFESTWRRVSR